MDNISLSWLISQLPESWREPFFIALIAGSIILNIASYLRRKIQPPEAGSKWSKAYDFLSLLAQAKGWAEPMFDIGTTGVKTTRDKAKDLKVVASENGIPVLGAKTKTVSSGNSSVVSSPKPDN